MDLTFNCHNFSHLGFSVLLVYLQKTSIQQQQFIYILLLLYKFDAPITKSDRWPFEPEQIIMVSQSPLAPPPVTVLKQAIARILKNCF